jgi:hypothetical protein
MPIEKTQPSCPCSRDLNWTGKGLTLHSRHSFSLSFNLFPPVPALLISPSSAYCSSTPKVVVAIPLNHQYVTPEYKMPYPTRESNVFSLM